MKRQIKAVTKSVATVAFYAFLLSTAFRVVTAVKVYGHAQQWWHAPPSLDAWDPQERIDAIEAEARKYGENP